MCMCIIEKSLFAVKDPQEYWFKKVPSSLNLPTLTFNLTDIPKEAKEILIHVMVSVCTCIMHQLHKANIMIFVMMLKEQCPIDGLSYS